MLMDNIAAVEARVQNGEDPAGLHLNARELRMLQLLLALINTDGSNDISVLTQAAKAAAEFLGEEGDDFEGQYNILTKVKKAHRTARLRLWKFAQQFYIARCSVVVSTIGNAVLTEATYSWRPKKLTILIDESCNISEWTLVCLFGAYSCLSSELFSSETLNNCHQLLALGAATLARSS
jgi:hypothetical protein